MDGIIVLDKPFGKTSHDMVYFVRRLFGIKKVGHTGTLDPEATGVLPICIGKATKTCDMLTNSDKAYTAELVLGMTTDTLDSSGEILTEQPINVTKDEIVVAINSFIGEIKQIPPMFSAVKKDGKKLYELARQGISVEREPRKIKIYGIKILNINLDLGTVKIDVECSKGTYIRTLCDDIGRKLGTGAYMNSLVRTKSAGYSIDNSYTAEELQRLKENGNLESAVIPLDTVFDMYDRIELNEFLSKKVKSGVRIRTTPAKNGKMYRLYDENGKFLSVSECVEGELVLKKAFWVD